MMMVVMMIVSWKLLTVTLQLAVLQPKKKKKEKKCRKSKKVADGTNDLPLLLFL